MKNIVKSYVRIHMYEFISEFMLVNSEFRIHVNEIIYEFIIMISCVNSTADVGFCAQQSREDVEGLLST